MEDGDEESLAVSLSKEGDSISENDALHYELQMLLESLKKERSELWFLFLFFLSSKVERTVNGSMIGFDFCSGSLSMRTAGTAIIHPSLTDLESIE